MVIWFFQDSFDSGPLCVQMRKYICVMNNENVNSRKIQTDGSE